MPPGPKSTEQGLINPEVSASLGTMIVMPGFNPWDESTFGPGGIRRYMRSLATTGAGFGRADFVLSGYPEEGLDGSRMAPVAGEVWGDKALHVLTPEAAEAILRSSAASSSGADRDNDIFSNFAGKPDEMVANFTSDMMTARSDEDLTKDSEGNESFGGENRRRGHKALRRHAAGVLTPNKIDNALAGGLDRYVNAALEQLTEGIESGRVDVSEIVGSVTSEVICDLLGIPSEEDEQKILLQGIIDSSLTTFEKTEEGKDSLSLREQIRARLDVVFGDTSSELAGKYRFDLIMMAATIANSYSKRYDEDPEQFADGLLGRLLKEKEGIPSLDGETLGKYFALLILAGYSTTKSAFSSGFAALAQDEEASSKIMDDRLDEDKIKKIRNEFLRKSVPVRGLRRVFEKDTNVPYKNKEGEDCSIFIPKGQNVYVWLDAANNDGSNKFSMDDEEDPLVFGFGSHFCLGSVLAKEELDRMIDTLLKPMLGLMRTGWQIKEYTVTPSPTLNDVAKLVIEGPNQEEGLIAA